MYEAGYLNKDFASATYDDGLQMLADGKGAHYPMLTFAVGAIAATNPDQVNDIGFFALPGDDAAKNGLTVWMPAGSTSRRPPSASSTRPRSSWPSWPAPTAATSRPRRRALRPVPGQGLRRCRPTCRRR